uniref:Small G protein signaling modulator 1a n=1 Tax=Eptatretus burgeri TaxID=7764 RepID=A0A8C4N6T4_EPTBU
MKKRMNLWAWPNRGEGRRHGGTGRSGPSAEMAAAPDGHEMKQRLLRAVKKEVKQIMEESVTRKFVHEDSSHIISFCVAVEGCLLHGLRRRTAGFLRSNKIAALFTKVGKSFEPAKELCRKVQELELQIERSQSSQDAARSASVSKGPGLSPAAIKHLWVRTALFEQLLDKISQHLVEHAAKYYEKDSLLKDQVDGAIFASLLVGPCTLEYTKMKTADHFWTDPSADELIQRHRIHGGHGRLDSPSKRPSLNISLAEKEEMEAIPGYLSLHQTAENLSLKWTPNQLMNGSLAANELEKSVADSLRVDSKSGAWERNGCRIHVFWDYAITVSMGEIVYIHCHQQPDNGGTVVLVSQDGIQQPPIHFPPGGHLLAFLSCLENGLLPHGQLDPPLWSQRGKGKVFPKLRRRCRSKWQPKKSGEEEVEEEEEEEAMDYVFRIVYPGYQADFVPPDLLELLPATSQMAESGIRRTSCPSCQPVGSVDERLHGGCSHDRAPLKLLCETMKRQILSRAFYGWLAYCRHLSTVRTHLSALIHHAIIPPVEPGSSLTADIWKQYLKNPTCATESEVLRLVYFGGVQHSIRREVWPFLLGHYKFGMTPHDRREMDEVTKAMYEHTMAEWLACEAIVRQREKESHAAALAKLSSGSSIDSHVQRLVHRNSSISNEVFESVENMDSSKEEVGEKPAAIPLSAEKEQKCDSELTDSGISSSRNYSLASSSRFSHGTGTSLSLDENGVEGVRERLSDAEPQNHDGQQKDGHDKDNFQYEGDEVVKRNSDKAEAESHGSDGLQEYLTEQSMVSVINSSNGSFDSNDKTTSKPQAIPQLTVHGAMTTVPVAEESQPVSNVAVPEQPSGLGGMLLASIGEDISPASSTGATYTTELLDAYALNLQRIEKDVLRCDRNFWYFTPENLDKLRNIMCSYVWEHLDVGYVQGMCDILAPLLVILDDEAIAYSCFTELMKRMNQNFPHGGAMDMHFANMRLLIQILDSDVFELMHQNGDYTHFYFCYRWFLLDFKRELLYEDVFAVWEVIWAARRISSLHFVLFIALAFVEIYRDIILDNCMDFTDIIKFFNEMAERHDAQLILRIARDLVHRVQIMVINK